MNALHAWSTRLACVVSCAVSCVLAGAGIARSADIITRPAPAKCEGAECQVVELFAGIDAGKVEAKLIPRDAKKARVFLTNKTKEPLNVRLPAALAGKVILAQFQMPGGGNMMAGGATGMQGRNVPQTLGISPNGRGMSGGMSGGIGAGVFNIPPEKVVEFRVDCVCLEYGKPNPRPVVPYELVKAESVASPETVAMLEAFGKGSYSQTAAQAAAWHLANNMSWEKLESLDGQLVSVGVHERRFNRQDIKDAKALVEAAEKAAAKAPKTSIGLNRPTNSSSANSTISVSTR